MAHGTGGARDLSGAPGAMRAVAAVSTVAGWIAAGMIVAAVAITCQMIFVRFVLNGSTVWQTEAVIYLVIGATLIGLPYVQLLRGHVNVDLVPLALPPRARHAMSAITLGLSIAIVGVMLFYGFEVWHMAWDRGWRSDTIWGVPLWIPYLAMPVGFALLMLQLTSDLYGSVMGHEDPFGIAPDAGLASRAEAADAVAAARPDAAAEGELDGPDAPAPAAARPAGRGHDRAGSKSRGAPGSAPGSAPSSDRRAADLAGRTR